MRGSAKCMITIQGKNYVMGITRSGRFTGNDVFSAALLDILFAYQHGLWNFNGQVVPDHPVEGVSDDCRPSHYFPVMRVNETSAEQMEDQTGVLLFNVGRSRYSLKTCAPEFIREKDSDAPTAAFGRFWHDIATDLGFDETHAKIFDEQFAALIDLADTRDISNLMSLKVEMMNPGDGVYDKVRNNAFENAVDWAYDVLKTFLQDLGQQQEKCEQIMKDGQVIIGNSNRNVVIYDTRLPVDLISRYRTECAVCMPESDERWVIESLWDTTAVPPMTRWEPPKTFVNRSAAELKRVFDGLVACTSIKMYFETKKDAIRYIHTNL